MLTFFLGMGDLAGTGDSPAIGMVMGLANGTDLHPAGVIGLDLVQAIRAIVFYIPDKFDLFIYFFLALLFLVGWLFDFCFWSWRQGYFLQGRFFIG